MRTFDDILHQLKQLEETTLLELLGVSSEDLVERFSDIIEDRMEQFDRELNQWFEEDSSNEET